MGDGNNLEFEAFIDEAVWIIHEVLPEDRSAVLSILMAYQKRAEEAAEARAAGAIPSRPPQAPSL